MKTYKRPILNEFLIFQPKSNNFTRSTTTLILT